MHSYYKSEFIHVHINEEVKTMATSAKKFFKLGSISGHAQLYRAAHWLVPNTFWPLPGCQLQWKQLVFLFRPHFLICITYQSINLISICTVTKKIKLFWKWKLHSLFFSKALKAYFITKSSKLLTHKIFLIYKDSTYLLDERSKGLCSKMGLSMGSVLSSVIKIFWRSGDLHLFEHSRHVSRKISEQTHIYQETR